MVEADIDGRIAAAIAFMEEAVGSAMGEERKMYRKKLARLEKRLNLLEAKSNGNS